MKPGKDNFKPDNSAGGGGSPFYAAIFAVALGLAVLIPLFVHLAVALDGPEEGQWSLVFYRGTNGGVKCPEGIEGLECALKSGGSIEDPNVSEAYTRDEFPQPLAACLQEGRILKENPFSPEARRLFGLNSMARDRPSFANKPRGHWDMILCVKGSKHYIFNLVKKYPYSLWLQHIEKRFVD